jgi:hypothetical protein
MAYIYLDQHDTGVWAFIWGSKAESEADYWIFLSPWGLRERWAQYIRGRGLSVQQEISRFIVFWTMSNMGVSDLQISFQFIFNFWYFSWILNFFPLWSCRMFVLGVSSHSPNCVYCHCYVGDWGSKFHGRRKFREEQSSVISGGKRIREKLVEAV